MSYNNWLEYIKSKFNNCDDVVMREIALDNKNISSFIVYIDDMIDRELIENHIIKNFLINLNIPNNDYQNIFNDGITTADVKMIDNIDDGLIEVMSGNTIVLVSNIDKIIVVSSKGFPKRSVEKPETEIVIQGPHEAFAESIRINTVLIRRRIRDTNLKCKQIKVGSVSQTDIAIMYMDNIVDKNILKELENRLENIQKSMIYDSGYLQQLIEDNSLSPFPQIQLTERPDKISAELNEGRIAVIVDNSPYVLLVPTVIASFYQSSEDYYQKWEIMSLLRFIRYIAGFTAFALPGLYIALVLYAPEIIPRPLALKLAEDRISVPFPTVIEVIGLELVFEALREAGIRMPSVLGGTLGIVGGIIIGQSAVDAGLISAMVVIIVALTGVCSFAIPNIALVSSFRLIKYFIIILSTIWGIYGFVTGIFLIVVHISGLKSFGVNYCEPFSGISDNSVLNDTIFRLPAKSLIKAKLFNRSKQNE